ncbi:MAG: hydrogenase maturation nickel metallochaperone HypA [Gammaproteobacteria bacterium]|nr:MAG: hydrogenase maturation nickel metallochaperone HypA [Gammaproteobacteria bacterium]
MHELSLALELRTLIEQQASQDGFRRVHRVRLAVGMLSCVEPEAMRFCFDDAMQGGPAEGAELDIERIPGLGRCTACSREVAMEQMHDPCPACGLPLEPVRGREIRLLELEVSD